MERAPEVSYWMELLKLVTGQSFEELVIGKSSRKVQDGVPVSV
jgi:hypothetical protein